MLYIEYVSIASHNTEPLLKYKFTNALWYKVGDKKTIATRVPLPGEKPTEIEITVQGFFRQSIYTVLLKPDHVHVIKIQQN